MVTITEAKNQTVVCLGEAAVQGDSDRNSSLGSAKAFTKWSSVMSSMVVIDPIILMLNIVPSMVELNARLHAVSRNGAITCLLR